MPETLEIEQVDSLRRGLVGQLGQSAHLLCRSDLLSLIEVGKGEIFFSKYRHFFAGPGAPAECVVLVNNLHRSGNPQLRDVARACRLIMEEAASQGLKVSFLSAQDVNHMDTLSALLQARRVILPFFTEHMLPTVLFLLKALAPEVPLTVLSYRPGEGSNETRVALKKLRTALRTSDRLREYSRPGSLRALAGEWHA